MQAVTTLLKGTQDEDAQLCLALVPLFRKLPSNCKISAFVSIQTYLARQILGTEKQNLVSDPCVDAPIQKHDSNRVVGKESPPTLHFFDE